MDGDMKFEKFLLHLLRDEFDEEIADIDLYEPIYHRGIVILHFAEVTYHAIDDMHIAKSLIDDEREVDEVNNDENTKIIKNKFEQHVRTVLRKTMRNCFNYRSLTVSHKYGQSAAEIIFQNSKNIEYSTFTTILNKIKKNCSNDSLLTAKTLLKLGCPFPRALKLKDTAITRYLLENGYDVNEQNSTNSWTALHTAVYNSDIENVKLLISYGADVNIKSCSRTLLDLLRVARDDSIEIFTLLVDQGVSVIDDNGKFTEGHLLRSGCKKFVKMLMASYHIDFNQKDASGDPLLYSILGNTQFDPIDVIRGQHFNVETIQHVCLKKVCLLPAAIHSNVRTIEFVLTNGAQVNYVYKDTGTALYCIFCRTPLRSSWRAEHSLKCIDLLLQHGADAQWKDKDGRTFFDYILSTKHFIQAKPILAHLALIEALGTIIDDSIVTQINSRNFFKNYFKICKRKVEELKASVISRSITLFKFLTDCEDKIVLYAKNNPLVTKLQLTAYSNRRSKLYYHKVLQKRVTKLVEIASLRKKALNVLSRVQGLENNPIIIEKIVDFLNHEDLQRIAQI